MDLHLVELVVVGAVLQKAYDLEVSVPIAGEVHVLYILGALLAWLAHGLLLGGDLRCLLSLSLRLLLGLGWARILAGWHLSGGTPLVRALGRLSCSGEICMSLHLEI